VYTGLPNYPGGRFFDGYGFFGPFKENFKGAEVRRAPVIPAARPGARGSRSTTSRMRSAPRCSLPFSHAGNLMRSGVRALADDDRHSGACPADVQARAARFLGTGFVAREPFGHRAVKSPAVLAWWIG